MAGRKKKSAEPKKDLFTPEEKDQMLLDLVGSIVGDKDVKSFILIADSGKKDHIRVYNMDNVRCLGYTEKLGLLVKNQMLVDMTKGPKDEDNKPKKRRDKKRSNN